MPPTIQNGTNSADKRQQQRPAERKSELINKVKYCNTLPDIPFDLKFITYPFENDRFIQYNPTSLERNYRYEVLSEHDLGVTIDLINRDLYQQSDPNAQLDPADEKLLEDDAHTPQDSMRSKYHAKSVSWLRKSEYISTEQTRFQPQTMEKVEAKVGFNVKKSFVEETLYMDRDTQIVAIQKTFDETKVALTQHYSKPIVTAVETYSLFPDFTNWKYPCAQVIFDSDPAEAGKNIPAQIEEMSQAMIRGVMDESGEQFVAYFLPTEETLEKRRRDVAADVTYEDDEEYEYKMAREYNWNVKSKASKGYEENYFLVFRPEGVYYNELETRVRLNKRRQKVGTPVTSTKLVVKHLPLNASEHRMQRYRERQLEAPGEEEEEVEESEPEEEDEVPETQETAAVPAADKVAEKPASDRSRSHSRSRSGSKSGSSRSGSRSSSRGKSRSQSRAARSASRATNKSRANSAESDGSRSGSGSRSPSPRRSKSRTTATRTDSRATNKSRRSMSQRTSRSASHSGSGSRSPSRSKSRSVARRSASRGTSKSGSRSASGSRSPSRSRSRSVRSASRGTQKSRASSRQSRSRSGSHSQSDGSRSRSRSKSGSRSGSGSRSRSGSRSNRSRSRSGSRSGTGSGSASPSE